MGKPQADGNVFTSIRAAERCKQPASVHYGADVHAKASMNRASPTDRADPSGLIRCARAGRALGVGDFGAAVPQPEVRGITFALSSGETDLPQATPRVVFMFIARCVATRRVQLKEQVEPLNWGRPSMVESPPRSIHCVRVRALNSRVRSPRGPSTRQALCLSSRGHRAPRTWLGSNIRRPVPREGRRPLTSALVIPAPVTPGPVDGQGPGRGPQRGQRW